MSEPELNPFASPLAVNTPLTPVATWAAEDAPGIGWVRLGLGMVYLGICGMLLTVICITAMALTSRSVDHFELGPNSAIGAVLGLTVIGFQIVLFLGPWFCLPVPAVSRAKPFILATVAIQLVLVAATILIAAEVISIEPIVRIPFAILCICGSATFVFFMRRLARYIDRDDLSKAAVHILVAGSILFAIYCGFVAMVQGAGGRDLQLATGLIALVLLVFSLFLFVMYANLINALRKALLAAK